MSGHSNININLEREMGMKTFIFDSNATKTGGYLFNDWGTMLEQVTLQGGEFEILFPLLAGGSVVIPPGTYDMSRMRLVGLNGLAAVDISNVVLENLSNVDSLFLVNNGSVANIPQTSSITFQSCLLLNGPTATAPMVQVDASNNMLVLTTNFSVDPAAVPLIDVSAGTLLVIARGSQLGTVLPIFSGLGAVTVQVDPGVCFEPAVQAIATVTVSQRPTYVPGGTVGVEWAGAVPTNFKDAVDRIAVAVAAGAAGPIA